MVSAAEIGVVDSGTLAQTLSYPSSNPQEIFLTVALMTTGGFSELNGISDKLRFSKVKKGDA